MFVTMWLHYTALGHTFPAAPRLIQPYTFCGILNWVSGFALVVYCLDDSKLLYTDELTDQS